MDLDSYSSGELQEFFLFSPISGIVLSPYNVKSEHYGVDVVSKKNEPVKCVADGTVILSDWTQEAGFVISVQHNGNLISIYKHNSALLKKVGTFVNAGDIISINVLVSKWVAWLFNTDMCAVDSANTGRKSQCSAPFFFTKGRFFQRRWKLDPIWCLFSYLCNCRCDGSRHSALMHSNFEADTCLEAWISQVA